MSRLNVGMIGLGHMGLLHMKICLRMKNVKVTSAADHSKRALKKAESIGVRNLYRDYQELIEKQPELDAVVISVPNFVHHHATEVALKSGIDVFVEKPMATTVEECKEIVGLVRQTGRKFMVGHSMRFVDAVGKMKNALDRGHIGRLEIATMESIQNGPLAHGAVPRPVSEWWFDPAKSGGGALLDLGYHLVDLFHFFAGQSEVLFSFLDHKFNLDVEDGATVVLQSKQADTRGIVNVGWFEKTIFPKFNFRVILHGNADYISSEDLVPKNPYIHAAKEGMKNFLRKMVGRELHYLSYSYYYDSYCKELQQFFESIEEDKEPPVSALDGLRTMETVSEAYRMTQEKK